MILIVDDNHEIVDWLVDTIVEAGYYADCALDAPSALYKLERIAYALALVDIRLPDGFDGNEIARRVKSFPEPFCSTPLVSMTGSLRVGPDDGLFVATLQKPFLPRDLRETIAEHARPPFYELHPARMVDPDSGIEDVQERTKS